jgi:hypothetical protein
MVLYDFFGYESKPWHPRYPKIASLAWLMDVYSPKYGNFIGFDPSSFFFASM